MLKQVLSLSQNDYFIWLPSLLNSVDFVRWRFSKNIFKLLNLKIQASIRTIQVKSKVRNIIYFLKINFRSSDPEPDPYIFRIQIRGSKKKYWIQYMDLDTDLDMDLECFNNSK